MPGMLPRRRDEFEWTLGFYKEAQTPIALLQRPLNLYRPVCSFLVLEKSSQRRQEF